MSLKKKLSVALIAAVCSLPVLLFGGETNQPPQVDAGPDQFIVFGDTPTLNGSFMDDGLPVGSSVTVTWCVVGSSPTGTSTSTVYFSNPLILNPSVVFTEPGVFILKLKVDDGELMGMDEMVVSVQRSSGPANQAPHVDAGPDQTIHDTLGTLLDGTVTDDGLPVGSSLTITWSVLISSPIDSSSGSVVFAHPNRADTAVLFPAPGYYVLKLSADDGQLMDMDTINIFVKASSSTANQPPIVDAGPNLKGFEDTWINLDGTVTDDGLPVGSTLTITWSVFSASGVTGPFGVNFEDPFSEDTRVNFMSPGIYVLRLKASDGEFVVFDDMVLTVNSSSGPVQNLPPHVSAGPNLKINFGQSAILNGTVADDGMPIGSSLTINWSVISSSPVLSGTQTVTFDNPALAKTKAHFPFPGIYQLRLSAFDGEFQTVDDMIVVVNSSSGPINRAPVVNIGPNQEVHLGQKLELIGEVTDDGLPNPPGEFSVLWSVSSASPTVSSSPTITHPNALETIVMFRKPGLYVLRLTAFDGELSGFDELVVRVLQPSPEPALARPELDGQIESESDNRIRRNNPSRIVYGLTRPGHSEIKIYNQLGHLVKTLDHGYRQLGFHVLEWDGTGIKGKLSSGIYRAFMLLDGQLIRKFQYLVKN